MDDTGRPADGSTAESTPTAAAAAAGDDGAFGTDNADNMLDVEQNMESGEMEGMGEPEERELLDYEDEEEGDFEGGDEETVQISRRLFLKNEFWSDYRLYMSNCFAG